MPERVPDTCPMSTSSNGRARALRACFRVASTCPTPSGSRNSSRSNTPGRTLGTIACSLVEAEPRPPWPDRGGTLLRAERRRPATRRLQAFGIRFWRLQSPSLQRPEPHRYGDDRARSRHQFSTTVIGASCRSSRGTRNCCPSARTAYPDGMFRPLVRNSGRGTPAVMRSPVAMSTAIISPPAETK